MTGKLAKLESARGRAIAALQHWERKLVALRDEVQVAHARKRVAVWERRLRRVERKLEGIKAIKVEAAPVVPISEITILNDLSGTADWGAAW